MLDSEDAAKAKKAWEYYYISKNMYDKLFKKAKDFKMDFKQE